MAINNHIYSDLDLRFLPQPSTGDVSMRYDEQAVIRSIRNLLSTNLYERLFEPTIGSSIGQLLFEPISPLTASSLKNEIRTTIENHEPRATIHDIQVSSQPDKNAYNVYISFFIENATLPTTITLLLERNR